MSVPHIVESALGGEEIGARVPLGGEDELLVTPTRTLLYRADGLLSDESVEEFAHDADRLSISEGRRKGTIELEYPIDGVKKFSVPVNTTEEALRPVLAGVLAGNGIVEEGESVLQTFRFSELTLVVTSARVVKHIGEAVWDADYEEYHYDRVTSLDFEEGSHSTQIVLVVDGRPQRIKAPRDRADAVAEHLKRALFSYHDVSTLAELNALLGDDEEEDAPSSDPTAAFGGIEPLSTSSDDEDGSDAESTAPDGASTDDDEATSSQTASTATAAEETTEFGDSGFEPASASGATESELVEELRELRSIVERQSALIESQQGTIETLIEELRQGR